MAEIPVTQRKTALNIDIPVVRQSTAGAQLLQQASGYAFDIANSIADQGQKNYLLRLETSIRQNVSKFQRDFGSDPETLKQNLDDYRDGLLENLDYQGLRDQVDAQFNVYSENAMQKALEARQKVLDTETEVSALAGLETARNALLETSADIYSPNHDVAMNAARKAQMQLQSLSGILSMTKADGTPMFTAEQQFSKLQSARDGLLENAAKVWMANQPDKIDALHKWQKGEVHLNMPDEKGTYDLNSLSPDAVFEGLIMQESGGRQFAANDKSPIMSDAGAIGIAQVMPATGPEAAKLAGLPWDENRYRTDAAYNKALGRAYFDAQLKAFGGNNTLALMAYNAGPGAVKDFMDGTNKTGKNPRGIRIGDPNKKEVSNQQFVDQFPFEETRNYVRSISTKVGVTQVNVRETLPPETKLKVDKAIIEGLKDQISLENMMDAKADRDLKKQSEQTFTDLMLQQQQGKLTVEMVDMAKPMLEPDKYLDARKMALMDNPTTQGPTYSRLLMKVSSGEDITEEARAARFNDRALSNEDYLGLLDRSNRNANGIADPIKVNEDFVVTTLGKYATDLGLPQAAALGPAQREYAERVSSFRDEKKRGPTFAEARDIADDVVRRYSLFTEQDLATQLPTPRFMAPGVKGTNKMTVDYMNAVAQETTKFYMQKANGNPEAMKNDPEFRREMSAIMKLQAIAAKREGDKTNAATK